MQLKNGAKASLLFGLLFVLQVICAVRIKKDDLDMAMDKLLGGQTAKPKTMQDLLLTGNPEEDLVTMALNTKLNLS